MAEAENNLKKKMAALSQHVAVKQMQDELQESQSRCGSLSKENVALRAKVPELQLKLQPKVVVTPATSHHRPGTSQKQPQAIVETPDHLLPLPQEGASSASLEKKNTVFTLEQVAALERRFQQSSTIRGQEKKDFAASIGLLAEQVEQWFRNRK